VTGLGRGSLYGAFTDKRTLFLRAIDDYATAVTNQVFAGLRNTDTAVVYSTYRELVELVGDGTLSARVAHTVQLEDWKEAVSLAQGDAGREGKVVFVFNEQSS
jgi:threonine dehydrogenase-like Zn-dependent dehydrogenase